MEEIYTDGYGNYYDALTGRQLDWYDLVARGIDVAGAALSHSPYYSPDDPRYRQQQGQYPYGQQYPGQYGAGVNTNLSLNRSGIGAGLNISTNTLMLIGGAVLLFILGTKRGR